MMWVDFLKEKSKEFEKFNIFKNKVENKSRVNIKSLRSDRGGEFTCREFNIYCEEHGIRRQLSSPHTPEQNGIAERRNKSIVEATRDMLFKDDHWITAMLFENDEPKTFWREAINTIVYTLNKVQIRKGLEKKPYELWFSHSPSVKYFRIFGSKCYIKRDDDIGKFDPRSDEGMFLGYSLKSKAYICFKYRKKLQQSAQM